MPAESFPLLEVSDLTLGIKTDTGWLEVTHGLNFRINQGESLGLVGESGCGKSLTAQSIMRLLPLPNIKVLSGKIIFQGINLLTLNSSELKLIRGNKIAMIFQEPMTALNPVLSVGKQILEQVKIHNPSISNKILKRQVIDLLTDVGIDLPSERYSSYPHQLSGGMRQRVMIAMAISCKPDLIIADEPTTALDVSLQAQVLFLLRKLQKKYQTAMLFISHDLAVVAQVCERAMIMYEGEIIEQGAISDLFQQPIHPYSQALLLCTPSQQQKPRSKLPSILPLDKTNQTPEQKVQYFKQIVEDFKIQERKPQNDSKVLGEEESVPEVEILRIFNLNKYYPLTRPLLSFGKKTLHAVKDISLSLKQGQTLGIVGTSGSGKSTLAKIIAGLEKAESGKIEFNQRALDFNNRKKLATDIQYIFQDPQEALNSRHTVEQILLEPLIIHNLGTQAERQQQVKEALNLVGLKEGSLARYPHEFSGGQKQRIGIARALMLKPKLLICDEPVSALDVSVQAQILNLLLELQDRLQLSMIFITHDLFVVRHMADNIAVMHAGELIEYGPAESICGDPQESYTQQLIAATPTWPIVDNALA
jgi:peptide/nickel transport system ATP-binding protein